MPKGAAKHHGRSGKQKRNEIKTKRAQKLQGPTKGSVVDKKQGELFKSVSRGGRENTLSSKFVRLSDDIVNQRKADSTRPFGELSGRKVLKVSEKLYPVDLGLPRRPKWDSTTTPEQLEVLEQQEFSTWLTGIHDKYTYEELSPFEHNLEVWRQLWRTLEKSHVVCLVADVRNPLLHIPLCLYRYVTVTMKKPMVIALTKVDLVPQEHVTNWKKYLLDNFPDLNLVAFSSKVEGPGGSGGVASRRKAITRNLTKKDKAAVKENAMGVLQTCIDVYRKLQGITAPSEANSEHAPQDSKMYPTVGFVGHPNVGKSSLLNAIMGKKVVSVSRTCGHTKHWQTHLVKNSDDVVIAELCDSPGLVFPAVWTLATDAFDKAITARHIYEVSGLYPIPQVREPFTAIRLLAECTPLTRMYNLKLDPDNYGDSWSPEAICGTYADKRGYSLSRSGAPDMHRAGLEILRDVVDGYVLFTFDPPDMRIDELNINNLAQMQINDPEEKEEEKSEEKSQ